MKSASDSLSRNSALLFIAILASFQVFIGFILITDSSPDTQTAKQSIATEKVAYYDRGYWK